MASTVTIKRRDTARKITDTLTIDGAALNLAGATVQLAWRAKQAASSETELRNATVTNAAAGQVEYQFVSGDTDVSGEFWLEWQVTLPGGRLTVPTADKHTLLVVDDLAAV